MLFSCYEEKWPLGYMPTGIKGRRYKLYINHDKSHLSSFIREDTYVDESVNIDVLSVKVTNGKILSRGYYGVHIRNTGTIRWFKNSNLSGDPIFYWSSIDDFTPKKKMIPDQEKKMKTKELSLRSTNITIPSLSNSLLFDINNSGDWPSI